MSQTPSSQGQAGHQGPAGAGGSGLIGASIPRKEDRRFITGAGRYVDDITLPNQTYGYILRSPYAHAAIKSINDVIILPQ